jgi:hypothetical protein
VPFLSVLATTRAERSWRQLAWCVVLYVVVTEESVHKLTQAASHVDAIQNSIITQVLQGWFRLPPRRWITYYAFWNRRHTTEFSWNALQGKVSEIWWWKQFS